MSQFVGNAFMDKNTQLNFDADDDVPKKNKKKKHQNITFDIQRFFSKLTFSAVLQIIAIHSDSYVTISFEQQWGQLER